MRQMHDEITQNLAERWCWEVARRDDTRVARRLYRTPEVKGVYRLDEGAELGDFFRFLRTIGVMALLQDVHGAALQREMVPYGQDCLALRREDVVRHRTYEGPATRVGQR
jgi:hypothetical protein